jgi:hypothetical protein
MMAIEHARAATPQTPIDLEWVRTEFNLPLEMRSQLKEFFLRIWTGSYVAESVQDGILYGRSDNWIVHWQSTPEVCKQAERVACSFRETYDGKRYVVIKVWDGRADKGDRK